MMEKGRRTLREARARQQYVKLSRQYYGNPGRSFGKGAPGHARKENPSTSSARCLSCGGQHRTDECPKKQKSFQSQHEPDDQAPFICLTDQVLATDYTNEKITTQQAVLQGKAVVDGWALSWPWNTSCASTKSRAGRMGSQSWTPLRGQFLASEIPPRTSACRRHGCPSRPVAGPAS